MFENGSFMSHVWNLMSSMSMLMRSVHTSLVPVGFRGHLERWRSDKPCRSLGAVEVGSSLRLERINLSRPGLCNPSDHFSSLFFCGRAPDFLVEDSLRSCSNFVSAQRHALIMHPQTVVF